MNIVQITCIHRTCWLGKFFKKTRVPKLRTTTFQHPLREKKTVPPVLNLSIVHHFNASCAKALMATLTVPQFSVGVHALTCSWCIMVFAIADMARHGILHGYHGTPRHCHGAPWQCYGVPCHGNCHHSPWHCHGMPWHAMVLHGTSWAPTNCHGSSWQCPWGFAARHSMACHGKHHGIVMVVQ